MKVFGLNILSDMRPALMGVATVMILCCHCQSWCNELPSVVKSVLVMGYVGVDIFLFLSGIGMYYSITGKKIGGGGKFRWYITRYKRILLPYLLISIPVYALLWRLDQSSFPMFVCNVSTLSYWLYHKGAWYVAMLIPLYIITPILVKILSGKLGWLYFIVLTAGCYACAVWFHIYPAEPHSFVYNVVCIIYRLPSYFLGITVAPYVCRAEKINAVTLYIISVLCTLLMGLCYKFEMPFEMFAAVLFVIAGSSILSTRSSIVAIIRKICISLGRISLESYLFNIFLPLLLVRISWDKICPGINHGNYLMYAIAVAGGLSLSYLCNRLYGKKQSRPVLPGDSVR